MEPDARTLQNIKAWDELYRGTSEYVWGCEAIGFLEAWIHNLQKEDFTDAQILEAGVGEGRNLPAIKKLGGQLTGCDASEHALAKIPESTRDGVNLVQTELSDTPFEVEQFRLICLLDVFETLPNVEDCMAELNRICQIGGYFLVNIPDLSDNIAGIDMESLPEGGYLFSGRYFYQFYSERDARAILERAGFEIIENKICSWEESPHPHFRDESHMHTSRVILARKNEIPSNV